MGRHQPTTVGHRGIKPRHLDRGHLQGPLANGRGDGVHGCPALTQHLLFPGLIAQQARGLLLHQLNAGDLAVAHAPGGFEQLIGAHLQPHLVIEGVAAHGQGERKTDGPMGAMVAIAKARITERIHRHHLRVGRVAARLQTRHRGDNLEGAGRWKALEGAIQQGRIGGIEAAPLAGTRRRRKNIGVKGGPAGQGPNCSGLGVERHDRPLAHPVEGALCSLLQRQVQGEPQVLASLSRLLANDALHLAGGVHLHLLAAPLATQVPLKLLLDPTAAHPILDPVALGLELGVFLFRDSAGVTEHVGC